MNYELNSQEREFFIGRFNPIDTKPPENWAIMCDGKIIKTNTGRIYFNTKGAAKLSLYHHCKLYISNNVPLSANLIRNISSERIYANGSFMTKGIKLAKLLIDNGVVKIINLRP